MGIRVNKCLGYGLIDVKSNEYQLCDERFNLNFFEDLREEDPTIKSYIDHIINDIGKPEDLISKDNYDPNKMVVASSAKHLDEEESVNHYIVYDFEYGLPNVILFLPPGLGYKEWARRDDPIDYQEALVGKQGAEPSIILSPYPIYPCFGYIYTENGERVPDSTVYYPIIKEWRESSDKDNVEAAKRISEGIFKVSLDELDTKITPDIPVEIIEFCNFYKIFKDPKTVYQLKPMIYTYWS